MGVFCDIWTLLFIMDACPRDRWQWEEGQCPRTIILPCIFTLLSPLNHFFSIMDSCLGHILESTKGIEIKHGTCIDVNKRKCTRQEPYTYLTLYLSYLPLLPFIKGGFLCHVVVYKWCLIARSAFYRQYAFGEHSSLPAISLFFPVLHRNITDNVLHY